MREDVKTISRPGTLRAKQYVSRKNNVYSIGQYFATKTNIYVIFAAARNENNPAIRLFLDSVSFDSAATNDAVKTIRFSQLKNSPFALTDESKTIGDRQNPVANESKPKINEQYSSPLTIIAQPLPGYTIAARNSFTLGTVRLRTTFSETGRISKIGITSFLPNGLTRQAVYCALRMKFLPAEKDNQPVSVTKTVEYSFSIR